MEDVDGGVVRHVGGRVRKSIKQELCEGIVAHVVVLDLAGRALVVDVVRRIGDHQVRLRSCHQQLECLDLGAVTTYQAVSSQLPEVSALGNRGILQLRLHIEVIIMHTIGKRVLEQIVDLGGIEAGERHVEVLSLQLGDEQCQLVLVPLAVDLVHGDVKGFLLAGIQLDQDAVLLGNPHVLEHIQPLVAGYDSVVVGHVDHDELDVAELLERSFQLLILGIPLLEGFARIVGGRIQVRQIHLLDSHGVFPFNRVVPARE